MTIALRPALPQDLPDLLAIFRASVEILGAEDYDDAQIDAWLAVADDEDAFAKKLTACLTLVAMVEGEVTGFASLQGTDTIEMLYVSPDAIRMGVATTLLTALEKLAGARGAKLLTTDASDTAEPFFAARGYTAQSRNTRMLDDAYLATTTMTKKLV